MSNSEVISFLQQYRKLYRNIENQTARLDFMESQISLGSSAKSDFPKSTSPEKDKIALYVSSKIDLENDIKDSQRKLLELRNTISTAASKLKNSDTKATVLARYIDFMKWQDVSFMLFGGNSDYLMREESYLRRTFALHKKAVCEIKEFL